MPACVHTWNKVTNCCHKCGLSRAAYDNQTQSALAALRVRCGRLEGALGFYAEPDNWREHEGVWTEGSRTVAGKRVPAHEDRGKRAKEALG